QDRKYILTDCSRPGNRLNFEGCTLSKRASEGLNLAARTATRRAGASRYALREELTYLAVQTKLQDDRPPRKVYHLTKASYAQAVQRNVTARRGGIAACRVCPGSVPSLRQTSHGSSIQRDDNPACLCGGIVDRGLYPNWQ